MPDTALTTHDSQRVSRLVAQCFDGEQVRKPALPGFLARKLGAIDWLGGVPDAWTLRWVIETCRAELDWSEADWRRMNRNWNGWSSEAYALAAPHQMPHEQAAARVLNAWAHVHVPTGRFYMVKAQLRGQRRAANDMNQSAAYRASWAKMIPGTIEELRTLIGQRRKAWPILLLAIAAYRQRREEADRQIETKEAA